MKKVISVFLSVLMLLGALQIGSAVAFADETGTDVEQALAEAPSLPDTGSGVSASKPFEFHCDYCGETHEGFFGMFIAMIHTFLSAVQLAKKAVER